MNKRASKQLWGALLTLLAFVLIGMTANGIWAAQRIDVAPNISQPASYLPVVSGGAGSPTASVTVTRTPTVAPTVTGTVVSGGPQVLNLSQVSGAPARNTKVEWSFDLSTSYANPSYFFDPSDTAANNAGTAGALQNWFGADGVSVDLHLTAPSGASFSLPAFWSDSYVRARGFGGLDVEVLGRNGPGQWHARFTPAEAGVYQFYLTAQDKSGASRFPASGSQSFSVAASAQHGLIQTSTKDSRYLAYSDGTPFIPIGAGQQWWTNNGLRSYSYADLFQTYGQNGVNLLRVWDQSDFALAVEGAQPVWLASGTVYGPAQGIEVATANVHAGLRAARPSPGAGWYQRLVVAQPAQLHKLTVWLKTAALSGGQALVQIKDPNGNLIAQITPVSGTTPWTAYSVSFTPNTALVSLNLSQSAGTGSMYVDDVAFGPVDGGGNLLYNILSDPDFERHFAKDLSGNDPNANPSLPRPLGNYVNPWSAEDLDQILAAAQANGVALQLCSCSGPWFSWPVNPDAATLSDPWYLKSWQRNFRYRVARWGYSPAVLGWEQANEVGHVPPGTAQWNFYQAYSAYQAATDPFHHLRTTSQNSQAYSPGLWSSSAMDLANYHDYMDYRSPLYTQISGDEVDFVKRFAWCLGRNPADPYCSGLGLGDGTSWSGPPKPWVWGEIGIWAGGTTPMQSGEAGSRFLHNIVWAGLFSPLGTTPLDWYQNLEDAAATSAKFAARKAAAAFFAGVDYDGGHFTPLISPADAPSGYSGELVTATDAKARLFGLKRADRTAVYLWVQQRDHIWSLAPAVPTAISPTLTLSGLLPTTTYQVEIWNTTTGVILSSSQQFSAAGSLSLILANLSDDRAIKLTKLP